MPKPRIRRKPPTVEAMERLRRDRRKVVERRATEHRALVLEAVATSPHPATLASIVRDCTLVDKDFKPGPIKSMTDWLWREGLLAKSYPMGRELPHFTITTEGLMWLTQGRFDIKVMEYAPRPKARKRRKEDTE